MLKKKNLKKIINCLTIMSLADEKIDPMEKVFLKEWVGKFWDSSLKKLEKNIIKSIQRVKEINEKGVGLASQLTDTANDLKESLTKAEKLFISTLMDKIRLQDDQVHPKEKELLEVFFSALKESP